jgi:hypothetical protein
MKNQGIDRTMKKKLMFSVSGSQILYTAGYKRNQMWLIILLDTGICCIPFMKIEVRSSG